MTNQFKAALFDLDGVVFDTETQYSRFWGQIFSEYYQGREELEQKIKGQTLEQIFNQWFNGALEPARASITERLNQFERTMDYQYVEGFEAFLDDLRSHGVLTAVVTSSNMPKMQSVFGAHQDFQLQFDAILTSEDFDESKPSPDCYLKAAAKLQVPAENCIVFEDSINGLRAGNAAQMMVVGMVTTNPLERVRQLSYFQMEDYRHADATMMDKLLADFNKQTADGKYR